MEQQTAQQPDKFEDSRFGRFTASEISRLLVSAKDGSMFGAGAITYINEKIAECITGEGKKSPSTQATEWGGMEHETDAIKWFTLITGIEVEHYGAANYKFFPYGNWGGCSPDGITKGEKRYNVQVKCPFVSANHIEYLLVRGTKEQRQQWLKKNQKDYYAQCQKEMMCCETEGCYFITYDPRTIEPQFRMAIFELSIDEEMRADIDTRLEAASIIVADSLKHLETLSITK